MEEFYNYWNFTVKPVVQKIVTPEHFNLILKVNNGTATKEEIEQIKQLVSSGVIEDVYSALYIGYLAKDVETSKNSLSRLDLINSLGLVKNTLSHDGTFYAKVWKNEINTEFRKNVYELGGLMPKLFDLFQIQKG